MPFPLQLEDEIDVAPTPPRGLPVDIRSPAERAEDLRSLQALVKALEAGGYDKPKAGPTTLLPGQPLKIESLEPVLKVATYGDPTRYKKFVKRCRWMSKLLFFFGARQWSALLYEAGLHFEKEAERLSVRLVKYPPRFP